MTKKDKLQKIIEDAARELAELEEKEAEQENKNLLGKHFKIPGSDCDSGHWYWYIKPIAVDGFKIYCLTFQQKSNGHISIYNTESFGKNYFSQQQEIEEIEFLDALNEILSKINAILTDE